MIKKGTTIECTNKLEEGGDDLLLNVGDRFIQSENYKYPTQKGHKYGGAWSDYLKIVIKPQKMDKDWEKIFRDISPSF